MRRWPAAWAWGAAFVVLSAASLAWGAHGGARDLAVWVAAAAIVAATSPLERREVIDVASATGLVVGGLSATHAVVTWSLGARGVAVHGLQGNANWLGLVLAACIPLSVERARRTRVGWIASIVVVFEVVALFLSHARVAWVALTLAAIVTIPWKNVVKPSRAVAVAAVALVVAGCSARFSRGRAPSVDATHEASSGVAVAGRAWIAERGVTATIDALPFGAGLGRWTHAYLEAQGATLRAMPVKDAARAFVFATTAHDDYVQAATESGPLAAIALLLFFVAASRALFDEWRAGAAVTISLGIAAFGDDPLHRPAAVVLLALVVATLGGREDSLGGTEGRRFFWVGAAIVCAVLLFDATRGWVGAHLRTAARDRDPFARVAMLERAARLDPRDGEVELELGLALLAVDEPERALVRLRSSRARFANVGTLVAIGNASLALDRPDDAISAYFSAISLDPGSFKAHADLASALLVAGRLDEAEEHARVALTLEPGVERVRALLDRIHEAKMDAAVN